MPKYRLLAPTFIRGSMLPTGEVVDYDGLPGKTLQPVESNTTVKIDAEWQALDGLKRIALARELGAPKSRLSAAEADQWISNEIENRKILATAPKAPAKAFRSTESST